MLRLPIYFAAGCLLAAGCCCPAISGRYYEVGLPPPSAAASTSAATSGAYCLPENCNRGGGRLAGLHGHHGWLGGRQNGPVPSQQQFDYVSPLPKFHPAPTRPVFEPHEFYSPPLASERPPAPHGSSPGKL